MLINSGSSNLANAHSCSFAFLDTPGAGSGVETTAQVILKGLLQDLSPTDVSIFEKSIISSYNEAFKKVGYTISTIEA
jgi:hypothetical protein